MRNQTRAQNWVGRNCFHCEMTDDKCVYNLHLNTISNKASKLSLHWTHTSVRKIIVFAFFCLFAFKVNSSSNGWSNSKRSVEEEEWMLCILLWGKLRVEWKEENYCLRAVLAASRRLSRCIWTRRSIAFSILLCIKSWPYLINYIWE